MPIVPRVSLPGRLGVALLLALLPLGAPPAVAPVVRADLVEQGPHVAPASAPGLAGVPAPVGEPAPPGEYAGPLRERGILRPLPPDSAPFDLAARRELAQDTLTYFVRQQGLFPGRGVFQLPAPPWWTDQGLDAEAEWGAEWQSPQRSWDMRVPAGLPLYLLAGFDATGWLDVTATTVSVDGVSLTGLERSVHHGIKAVAGGQLRDVTVLDVVFAPPPAGRYRVEVHTTPPLGPATTLVYDLTVLPPDGLGPRLLREEGGALYAVLGHERLRVPDPQTLRVLGYSQADVLPAGPATLAALPEGDPIPALREGMLARAPDGVVVFRLEGGRRVRVKDAPPARAVEVHGPVLDTIPPQLQDGMVLRGGTPDVFLVDGGQLRKVPDWVWLLLRGYRMDEEVRVPQRILGTLPQNSPHWVMPGGAWRDTTFPSPILGRVMPYRVFLPPGYDSPATSGRRYPVVYLLHGMGGRYDEWSGYGVEEVANQLLADGDLPEVILVLPQGGLGYWMNQDGAGGTPWAEYVARDLVRHVDATYRTQARREARAVGGLSMGGHGAVQLALTYPEVFGIAGAHSPSIRERGVAPAYFGADAEGFARRDPVALVREADLTVPPRIWIDVGADDPWRPGAEALREALQEKGWAHEWQLFPGDHDGWYWGDHLWEYLPYYGRVFREQGIAP